MVAMGQPPPQDTLKRHGLDVVPPATVASPTQMLGDDDNVAWWTPTWRDIARQVGWKWIFALPAFVVIGLGIGSIWYGRLMFPLWMVGVKVLAVSLAIPLVLMLEVARVATSARKDPFCIHCGYGLTGLPDHHTCPECGRPYSFDIIEEYRRDPHWFRQRHKMRGQMPRADAPFIAGKGPTAHDGT